MIADPGHRPITHPLMPRMEPIIQSTWSAIRRGETAVRPALEEANQRMNAILAGTGE